MPSQLMTRMAKTFKKIYEVFDNCNRADAGSLGNAVSGQAWTVLAGTWEIVSNGIAKTAGVADAFAVVESGVANAVIEAPITIRTTGTHALCFRLSDIDNLWLCNIYLVGGSGGFVLTKREASAYADIGTAAPIITSGQTYRLRVETNGASIRAYLDGVLQLSISNTFNQAATQVGFSFAANDANSRADDLLVKAA